MTKRKYRPCEQCASNTIQGMPVHEIDCPLSHIDLATGKPYQVECRWCGNPCDTPATHDKRVGPFCDHDCRNAYYS